ncbi:MAG: Gfo/Idh/MocA family oxidoreductase [SAR202 cluster bacterium]|nr:Gfo/Idh/MocA family oxidoreductase [SAR202 cluster bacterium]
MDTVGLGVVGPSGVIGQKHVAEVTASPHAKLVGIHDMNQDAAAEQAVELGTKHYSDLEALLGDPDIDAITIATPHPTHRNIALQAFKAGKHVLTEKPLAASPAESDEMVEAASAAGRTLGVVYQNRLRPDAIRVKQLIDEGYLGKLYRTSIMMASFRAQSYYDSAPWRGTWKGEGGGALFNQGVHYLDLFQWLGGMPVSVMGQAGTLMHDIEVEDSASALVEYANGAQGYIHCNTVQTPSDTRMEFWGERRGIVITDDYITVYEPEVGLLEFSQRERGNPFAKPTLTSSALDVPITSADHQDAIDDFALAIGEGREPAVTGHEGTKSLELASAIILSSCRRRTVDLPIDRIDYDELVGELAELGSLFTQGA